MTLRTKSRLAAAVLGGLLLWVPGHKLLVERFDLNPWKFGGFAMYAVPAPKIGIGFYTEENGSLVPLRMQSHPDDQPLFLDFFSTRKHMGMWARPDALATRVFERNPAIDQLAIVITSQHIDPQTAKLEKTQRGYRYQR